MDLKHEPKADRILDLYDKAAELLKSTDSYLKNHNEDDKQIDSTLNHINYEWTSYQIQKYWFPIGMWQKAKSALSDLPKNENELFSNIKCLCEKITDIVCTEINNELRDVIYVSKPLMERIFKIFNVEKHTKAVCQLVFDCCRKCTFTAPKESYEYSIKLIGEVTGLLSGNTTPHPGYIYDPSHQQRTFDKCPICGGESEPYYCAFSYMIASFNPPFEPFKLWRKCSACGNLHTWKFPEEYLALSSNEKIVTPSENAQYKFATIQNAMGLAIWGNILNKIKAYNDSKTLLEVGIGNGELLSVALEMGYETSAVEIEEEMAQDVSDVLNIPIWNGDFLNFKTDKTFSVIIMGDVIEHVTNPESALRNAHRLLDDDGVLWLSTPNFESAFTRLKKFNDPMWNEPYHITYFNYDGLEALLDKCGFTVREYTVSNRYNGSMELIITKK